MFGAGAGGKGSPAPHPGGGGGGLGADGTIFFRQSQTSRSPTAASLAAEPAGGEKIGAGRGRRGWQRGWRQWRRGRAGRCDLLQCRHFLAQQRHALWQPRRRWAGGAAYDQGGRGRAVAEAWAGGRYRSRPRRCRGFGSGATGGSSISVSLGSEEQFSGSASRGIGGMGNRLYAPV